MKQNFLKIFKGHHNRIKIRCNWAIAPYNYIISFTTLFYIFHFLHLFNIFLSNGWDVTFNLHPSMLLHQVQYPRYCTWSQSTVIEQQTLLMEETMEDSVGKARTLHLIHLDSSPAVSSLSLGGIHKRWFASLNLSALTEG